jgi:anaerobic sulfite reductase subunit C
MWSWLKRNRSNDLTWSAQAEEQLTRAPSLVRGLARRRAEQIARASGRRIVGPADVMAAKPGNGSSDRLALLRLIEGPNADGRLYCVQMCLGDQGCPNRVASAKALADRLERIVESYDLTGIITSKVRGPVLPHHRFQISVSGCPNACSRPQIADFGVVAVRWPTLDSARCHGCGQCVEACHEGAICLNGESMARIDSSACVGCGQCITVCPNEAIGAEPGTHWQVMIGGRLGRHPRLAVEIARGANDQQVDELLRRCLNAFRSDRSGIERFADLVRRDGPEVILGHAGDQAADNRAHAAARADAQRGEHSAAWPDPPSVHQSGHKPFHRP